MKESYHCAVLAVWTQKGPTSERVALEVDVQGSSAIQLIFGCASVSSCSDSMPGKLVYSRQIHKSLPRLTDKICPESEGHRA